jgi:futalosine hydrolase
MEGYAVALACALAGVPVSIVRGASNVVGDRDPARWRIPSALSAARERALRMLREPEHAP